MYKSKQYLLSVEQQARLEALTELFKNTDPLALSLSETWKSAFDDDPLLSAALRDALSVAQAVAPKGFTGELVANSRVGHFRIEKKLADGGMGSVYLATSEGDIQMKVALKTLSSWQPELSVQFQKECHILSGLQHPHIAHIIDAGTTEQGQPWLAMEYVEGKPFNQYLEQHDLPLKEKLKLYLQVCSALSHAHQQMVIHRDIKPGNILVNEEGHAKLLDFGIASLLDPETGEQKTVTLQTHRMMTPEYASPEQLNGLRLTTSSDVYSMGVLLYEMLTGRRPHELKGNTMAFAQTVHHETITRPSVVAATNTREKKHLRGDLDTIVMKALAKDQAQRYASVEALASDLRAYLKGQPIAARPATLGYRFRKFLVRNPWQFALMSGFVLALISFTSMVLVQKRAIARERDLALRERNTAQQVSRFMAQMFEEADPDKARGEHVSALEVLEAGRRQISQSLEKQPQVLSQLQGLMGTVYHNLGRYETSRELLNAAVSASEHPSQTWDLRYQLGLSFKEQGKYQEALKETVRLARDLDNPVVYSDSRKVRLGRLQGNLWMKLGNFIKASEFFEQTRPLVAQLTREEQGAFAFEDAMHQLNWGKHEEGSKQLAALLEQQRADYGPMHSAVIRTQNHLAQAYANQGDYDKADALLDEAITSAENHYQTRHPVLAGLLLSKGNVAMLRDDFEPSAKYLTQALDMVEALETEALLPKYLNALASCYTEKGDYEQGEALYQRSLEICRSYYGNTHQETAGTLVQMGAMMRMRGDMEQAHKLSREGTHIFKQVYGEMHPDVAYGSSMLALVIGEEGDLKAAENLLRTSLNIFSGTVGENNPRTWRPRNNLGLMLLYQKRFGEAREVFEKGLPMLEAALGENHLDIGGGCLNLALCYMGEGRYEEAQPLLQKSMRIMKSVVGERHLYVALVGASLASVLSHTHPEEGLKIIDEVIDIRREKMTQNPFVHDQESLRGMILYRTGKKKEGLEIMRAAYAGSVKLHGKDHLYTTWIVSRFQELSESLEVDEVPGQN